jgi:hypothetical protein
LSAPGDAEERPPEHQGQRPQEERADQAPAIEQNQNKIVRVRRRAGAGCERHERWKVVEVGVQPSAEQRPPEKYAHPDLPDRRPPHGLADRQGDQAGIARLGKPFSRRRDRHGRPNHVHPVGDEIAGLEVEPGALMPEQVPDENVPAGLCGSDDRGDDRATPSCRDMQGQRRDGGVEARHAVGGTKPVVAQRIVAAALRLPGERAQVLHCYAYGNLASRTHHGRWRPGIANTIPALVGAAGQAERLDRGGRRQKQTDEEGQVRSRGEQPASARRRQPAAQRASERPGCDRQCGQNSKHGAARVCEEQSKKQDVDRCAPEHDRQKPLPP